MADFVPDIDRRVPRRSTGPSLMSATDGHPRSRVIQGRKGVEISTLLDEADVLYERLHRVVVALTITEDCAADALQRLADAGGQLADQHGDAAQRARSSAELCRELGVRLGRLHPLQTRRPP